MLAAILASLLPDGFAKFSKNPVYLTSSVSQKAQQRAVALPQETTVSFSIR